VTNRLVFLHGLESGPRGSKYLALAAMQAGSVLAPDTEGIGDPSERLRAIEASLAGLDRLLLVGSSFGGLMAVRFAAAHPDRVAGLVLCAPALHRAEWGPVPDVPAGLPVRVLHGESDELVPLASVQEYCFRNGLPLRVVADGHRLAASLDVMIALVREVVVEAGLRTQPIEPR